MRNIKAGYGRVVVEEITESNQSGLFLGNENAEGITRGEVVDFHLDKDNTTELKAGDVVQFKTSYASKVKVDGEEYFVVSARDILIIEPEE